MGALLLRVAQPLLLLLLAELLLLMQDWALRLLRQPLA